MLPCRFFGVELHVVIVVVSLSVFVSVVIVVVVVVVQSLTNRCPLLP